MAEKAEEKTFPTTKCPVFDTEVDVVVVADDIRRLSSFPWSSLASSSPRGWEAKMLLKVPVDNDRNTWREKEEEEEEAVEDEEKKGLSHMGGAKSEDGVFGPPPAESGVEGVVVVVVVVESAVAAQAPDLEVVVVDLAVGHLSSESRRNLVVLSVLTAPENTAAK